MEFSEEDFRLAFEAAFEAGKKTPAEIKAFVVEWLITWRLPMVLIDAQRDDADSSRLDISVSIYSPSGSKH